MAGLFCFAGAASGTPASTVTVGGASGSPIFSGVIAWMRGGGGGRSAMIIGGFAGSRCTFDPFGAVLTVPLSQFASKLEPTITTV